MESILGVHDTPTLSAAQELGVDAVEADRQDQDDLSGQLRDRYVRTFWEPVVEGVVSGSLFPGPDTQLTIVPGPRHAGCPPTRSSDG